MLLIVPALLSTTIAAIAVDPARQEPPPLVLLNGAVVPGGHATASRDSARLIYRSAGRHAAYFSLAQTTPEAPVRGPGPTAQLHLIKVVRNDSGGTALETDWILSATGERADGPTNLSGTSPVGSRYTLTETYAGSDPRVGESYTAGPWRCVITGTSEPVAVSQDSKVVVNFSDDVTCTIINSYGTTTPTFTPTPTSRGPCTKFKLIGRKLYRANEGPFKTGLVGLAGWTITATLVGTEGITPSTTTNALGEFELSMDYPGPMAFPGATIRVCEAPRVHWVSLTPACATVTIPYPLPPTCALPVPDFVNAQEYRPTVDP
jgi:hypothetical protein